VYTYIDIHIYSYICIYICIYTYICIYVHVDAYSFVFVLNDCHVYFYCCMFIVYVYVSRHRCIFCFAFICLHLIFLCF